MLWSILKEEYNSGVCGLFLNPFLLLRKALWGSIERHARRLHGKLLDMGCCSKHCQPLFKHAEQYGGMECYSPAHRVHSHPNVFYGGEVFPFAERAFGSSFSSEVLEHVFNPQHHLKEYFRVLKPGV